MTAPLILAIDPGTEQSGVVWLRGDTVEDSGVYDNDDVIDICRAPAPDFVAIEMIASYGMAVGKEVFETCRWIGRFQQSCIDPDAVRFVFRKDVKLHLCSNGHAKDPNIRQALIDLLGPQGTKKAPGPTYGVKSHAWAALGVAVTALAQIEASAAT